MPIQVIACCMTAPNITWTNVDLSSVKFYGIYLSTTSQEMFDTSITKMRLKMTHLNLPVWYKTKFGSQNFGYQLWCLFCNISNLWCFKKYVQCGSNNNVIKYCDWGIPHNWNISLGKFGGLRNLVPFPENWLARQEQIDCFKYSANEFAEVPHTIGCNISQGTVC